MIENICFRNLKAEDYDQMIEVWNKSGLPVKTTGRDSRQALTAHLNQEPDYFLGAFMKEKLIGLVLATSDKRKGWINRLAVIPEYRGRGIARELIRRAESALIKNGIRIFSCLIYKDNKPSIKLFESENYDSSCPVLYLRKALSEEV